MSDRRKNLWLSLLLSGLYGLVWLGASYPYRLFPGEDQTYLFHPTQALYLPVFLALVQSVKSILLLLGAQATSALLVVMLFSHALTLFLLYWLIWFLTENRGHHFLVVVRIGVPKRC